MDVSLSLGAKDEYVKGAKMNVFSLENALKNLMREVLELREEVRGIKNPITKNGLSSSSAPNIKFWFERCGDGRFPFLIRLDGLIEFEKKLTSIQAAIMLVLFADLQQRQRNGIGFADPFRHIAGVEALLLRGHFSGGNLTPNKRIRVAVDRFRKEVNEKKLFTGIDLSLKFKNGWCRLEPTLLKSNEAFSVEVEFIANDSILYRCLDEQLSVSQLTRVSRQRVLYVPGGAREFDQLFLEFFDHDYPVHEKSLYCKPSIITYPEDLLKFLNVSQQDVKRKRIMFEGFKSGRCFFTEILNHQTLQQMITREASGVYKLYGPRVTKEMVAAHFDEIISMVETKWPNYQLLLTDTPLPFLISTFQINREKTEGYTVFFRQLIREHDSQVEGFAILNNDLTARVNENIISRVLHHATTVREQEKVIKILKEHAERLFS